MTSDEARTFFNIEWLKKRGATARKDFLVMDNRAMDARALAWKERVYVSLAQDPLKDWPNGQIPPINASSWSDCADDGLVEYGWFGPELYPCRARADFWGIRLTDRARSLLGA